MTMLFFDGEEHEIADIETEVEVYESLKLDELIRFCQARGISPDTVDISSAGDPFLPTPISWKLP